MTIVIFFIARKKKKKLDEIDFARNKRDYSIRVGWKSKKEKPTEK